MSSITPERSSTELDVSTGLTVSVVIPCLNEEETVATCVARALVALQEAELSGEVVVVDNGSEDQSAALAAAAGARVITETRRGYGSAYMAGFAAARGEFILMADADLTYDFGETGNFVARLQAGADLVMGDRMDNIQPGAMPALHQYIGNPLLTGVLNLLFRTGVRDAHCGMRAFRRSVLPALDLRTTGMEFASEMVIRASKVKLTIDQVPITYHPRGGESKLDSFRDGWRHLRFLLVHSPTFLFMLPGALLFVLGAAISVIVGAQISIFGRIWQLHALIGGSLLAVVGVQLLGLGLCAHAYTTYFMGDQDPWFDRMRARFRLEHGLALGSIVGFAGFVLLVVMFVHWISSGFGALADEYLGLAAATLIIIGVQIFFTSFLLSILGLRRIDRS